MIKRIIISSDKKRAVIHYDTHSIELTHNEAKILDLIIYLLIPNVNADIDYKGYIESFEDTAIIPINKMERF